MMNSAVAGFPASREAGAAEHRQSASGSSQPSASAHVREAWGEAPQQDHEQEAYTVEPEPPPDDYDDQEYQEQDNHENEQEAFDEHQGDAFPNGDDQYYEQVVKRLRWSDEEGYALAEVYYCEKLHYADEYIEEEQRPVSVCCAVM